MLRRRSDGLHPSTNKSRRTTHVSSVKRTAACRPVFYMYIYNHGCTHDPNAALHTLDWLVEAVSIPSSILWLFVARPVSRSASSTDGRPAPFCLCRWRQSLCFSLYTKPTRPKRSPPHARFVRRANFYTHPPTPQRIGPVSRSATLTAARPRPAAPTRTAARAAPPASRSACHCQKACRQRREGTSTL